MKIQGSLRYRQYLSILITSIFLLAMNIMPTFAYEGNIQSGQELEVQNIDNEKQVHENVS